MFLRKKRETGVFASKIGYNKLYWKVEKSWFNTFLTKVTKWKHTQFQSSRRHSHDQDCCEHVYIESIVGNPLDLIMGEMLVAEEVINTGGNGEGDSCTWTFYKFATFKGYVDVRGVGESNGYYSESVDLKYEAKQWISTRQKDCQTKLLNNTNYGGNWQHGW